MVDRFQKVIDRSPDAILIDVGERVVYVNNATVRLFGGASAAEMLGRSRLEFIHPDCHAAVKERIKKLIQDAEPVASLDSKWFHLDGGVIDYEQGNQREITRGGFMEEVPEVAALFGMKADLGGISPIERLLNEFEAHEMKEEKSLEQYKELMGDLPRTSHKVSFAAHHLGRGETSCSDSRDGRDSQG